MKTLYLGGGGFWTHEAIFQRLRGIKEVVPGYMGGAMPNPSYEEVSGGMTGHAEVVKLYYDNDAIDTGVILDIFFQIHNPTIAHPQQLDKGNGHQYRSVIFYTADQLPSVRGNEDGEDVPGAIQRAIDRADYYLPEDSVIVTDVLMATDFYPAEQYHYNYYVTNMDSAYSVEVIKPVVKKIEEKYGDIMVHL